jgi:hypothetical protein
MSTVRVSLLGGIVGAALNLLVYVSARALGVDFVARFDPDAAAAPLPFVMPVAATLIASLVASFVASGLRKWSKRPASVFALISALFLLVSVGGPLTLGAASHATKAALVTMHVIAALCIVRPLYHLLGRSRSTL